MAGDLEAMTLDDLRRRRDHVREEEEEVSYRRRLLHAQLDIVEASTAARDLGSLEVMLAEVLRDAPTPGGDVRSVAVEGGHDDVDLAPLPSDLLDLSQDERDELVARLREDEQATSDRRRALLDELDALQAELVQRYRRDGVDARSLLGEGS